jgi:Leucine-rich repeat (LRR) protein
MLIVDGQEVKEEKEVLLTDRLIRVCLVKSSIIRDLNLSNNELSGFKVGDLPNLQKLNLSRNRFTSFNVVNFPNLELLSLSNNRLVSFKTENSTNLKMLNLYNNKLSTFHLENLPSLQELYLSRNRLTSFKARDLLKLKILHLYNNRLSSFEVLNLPNLKILNLFGNPLCFLPLDIQQVPELFALDLKNTKVRFIDPSLKKFTTNTIGTRSHALGLSELLVKTFEIDNHPVLEEIREHIEV